MALPYSATETLFDAAVATAAASLDHRHAISAATVQINYTGAGFTGTLDFQGRLHESDNWQNLTYVVQDGTPALAVAQVSETTDSSDRMYQILNPMPFMRVNMTRSAGAVTLRARYFGAPLPIS